VRARIGYAGTTRWTPWVQGFLKEGGAGLAIDANGVTGTINVLGAAESYNYEIDKEKLKAAGWDASKILEVCADGMGMKLNITLNATVEISDYLLIGEGLTKTIIQGPGSFPSHFLGLKYFDIVKRICSEMNLSFLVSTGVEGSDDAGRMLHIGTKGEFARGQVIPSKVNTYMIRGIINEEKNQYPCIDWTPEGSQFAAWLASQPDPAAHNFEVSYIPDDTGEMKHIVYTPQQQDIPTVGPIADGEPEDVEVDGIKEDESRPEGSSVAHASIPVQPKGDKKAEKQAASRQQQGNAAQRGVITTLGLHDERTGNLCVLKGAGAIYDGPYTIDKLTHIYAPGSWDMTLTCHREGRVLKTGEQKETQAGELEAPA
jgi:hypothetical protein